MHNKKEYKSFFKAMSAAREDIICIKRASANMFATL